MASMRLNIPTIFVSGGPMEAGELDNRHLDLIDAMIESADTSVSDERIAQVERNACPGCGCCSGMFTANSMNCLNEAIGLALPGLSLIHIWKIRSAISTPANTPSSFTISWLFPISVAGMQHKVCLLYTSCFAKIPTVQANGASRTSRSRCRG